MIYKFYMTIKNFSVNFFTGSVGGVFRHYSGGALTHKKRKINEQVIIFDKLGSKHQIDTMKYATFRDNEIMFLYFPTFKAFFNSLRRSKHSSHS